MTEPDPPARISPLTQDRFDDDVRKFLARWTGGSFSMDPKDNPPLLTFAHHPRLAELFSRLNIHLLTTSTVPLKQRQIAIMRTCWRCKAVYMWSSHLRTSVQFGLSPEMYRPIQVGADDPYFTGFERTIIRATDELVDDRKVGDASWDALRAEWNEQQMLDFLFTVGCYVMTAGVMRSLGIEREPELLELAARYGAPEPD